MGGWLRSRNERKEMKWKQKWKLKKKNQSPGNWCGNMKLTTTDIIRVITEEKEEWVLEEIMALDFPMIQIITKWVKGMPKERHTKARERQPGKDKNVLYSRVLIKAPRGQKAKWWFRTLGKMLNRDSMWSKTLLQEWVRDQHIVKRE